MICKTCGKEIDDDSLFCPNCGEDVSDLSDSYYDEEELSSTKKYKKSIGIVLVTIIFFVAVSFVLVFLFQNGSSKYYESINEIIENQLNSFEFDGQQVISNVEIDYNNNKLNCYISSNNVDLEYLNDHCVNIQQDEQSIQFCDVYCIYDLNEKSFCFGDKYHSSYDARRFDVVNNDSSYKYCEKICDNINFKENTVYQFSYTVWFGVSKPNGILEKLYYKENKSKLKQEANYISYFLYKNGKFEPVFLENLPYDAINAVWDGSELYEAEFENGNLKYGDFIRNWKG